MVRAEQEVRLRTLSYMITLREWQETQGVESVIPVVSDPLTGQWELSGGGLLEFSSGKFHWYRDADDIEGDYRCGDYSVTPGIMVNAGFVLDRGREFTGCFSVFPHYTHDRTDGRDRSVDYQGVIYVEQMGSSDEIAMYNHRTDDMYRGNRMHA